MPSYGEKVEAIGRKVVPATAVLDLCTSLRSIGPVFGPVSRGKAVVFDELESGADLDLRSTPFTHSPKPLLHRPQQVLLTAKRSEGFQAREVDDSAPLVLFGVRPCDVNAFFALDQVFGGDYPNPHWVERRKKMFVVAANCVEMADNCFCASLGTGPGLDKGFDLLLTRLEGRWLVEAGTPAGKAALDGVKGEQARPEDLDAKAAIIRRAAQGARRKLDAATMPERLRKNWSHAVWKQRKDECLGCTSCTSVCPTCFCYDVADVVDAKLDEVKRTRHWAGCPTVEFARVHGGNFRADREDRLKQFAYHKLAFWQEQYGRPGCVGCGRCVTWCPAKIDMPATCQEVAGGEAK